MGNTQNNSENFDPTRYVRPGVTREEVMGLKNVFDQLEPKVLFLELNLENH